MTERFRKALVSALASTLFAAGCATDYAVDDTFSETCDRMPMTAPEDYLWSLHVERANVNIFGDPEFGNDLELRFDIEGGRRVGLAGWDSTEEYTGFFPLVPVISDDDDSRLGSHFAVFNHNERNDAEDGRMTDFHYDELADKKLTFAVRRDKWGDHGMCEVTMTREKLINAHNSRSSNRNPGLVRFEGDEIRRADDRPCQLTAVYLRVDTQIPDQGGQVPPAMDLQLRDSRPEMCSSSSLHAYDIRTRIAMGEGFEYPLPSWSDDERMPLTWRDQGSPTFAQITVDWGGDYPRTTISTHGWHGEGEDAGNVVRFFHGDWQGERGNIEDILDGGKLVVAAERDRDWYVYAACDLEVDYNTIAASHNSRLEHGAWGEPTHHFTDGGLLRFLGLSNDYGYYTVDAPYRGEIDGEPVEWGIRLGECKHGPARRWGGALGLLNFLELDEGGNPVFVDRAGNPSDGLPGSYLDGRARVRIGFDAESSADVVMADIQ